MADGDYTKHEQSLAQMFGRIGGIEKEIRELIEEKNKTTDPAKSHETVAEIKKLMIERKETIQKYNKEYYHVEYEHPSEMSMEKPGKKAEAGGGHGEKKEGHGEKGDKKEEKSEEKVGPGPKKIRYKRYEQKAIQGFEDEVNKLLSNVYDNVKKKYNQD